MGAHALICPYLDGEMVVMWGTYLVFVYNLANSLCHAYWHLLASHPPLSLTTAAANRQLFIPSGAVLQKLNTLK